MAGEGLLSGPHVMVSDTKLLAGLSHNGSDLWVVGLDDTREEVVGGLVVEGTWDSMGGGGGGGGGGTAH